MDNFNPDEFLAQAEGVVTPEVTPVEQAMAAPSVVQTPQMPTPVANAFNPDEFLAEADKQKYESPEQLAKTFGEGIGEGALGPVFTLAQRAANVNPEDIKGRKETNPMTYGAGQVTGLGASLLTGVGEGALAAKAGQGASKALGLAKAETVLGKIGAEALDQATQMALMQGSDEISRMIINDPEATSQNAIANVGLAAALGGVTGAAIGSISPLWKASGIGEKTSKFAKEFSDEIKFLRENPEPIQQAAKELEDLHLNTQTLKESLYSNGLKGDLIKTSLPEATPQNVTNLNQHLQDVSDYLSNQIKKAENNHKLKGHAKLLEQDLIDFQNKILFPTEYEKAAAEQARSVAERKAKEDAAIAIKDAAKKAEAEAASADQLGLIELPDVRPQGFNPLYSEQLAGHRERMALDQATNAVYHNKAAQTEFAFDTASRPVINSASAVREQVSFQKAYEALNDLKKSFQTYAKKGGAYGTSLEASEFGALAGKLGSELKPMLEDSKVWGKAADIQVQFNKAFSEFSQSAAEKDFLKTFTNLVGDERVINPAKINTFVNQVGKPNAEIKSEILNNYIKEYEKFATRVNKVALEMGEDELVAPHSINTIKKLMGEKTAGAEFAQQLVNKLGDKAAGRLVGGAAGAGLGAGMFGPIGGAAGAVVGEHALSPLLGSVFNGLTKSMIENAGSGGALKSALDYSMQAAKAAQIMTKGAAAVLKPTAQVIATHMIPSDSDRKKLDKVVDEMTTNPDKLTQINNGKLGNLMPNHQMAMSATVTKAAMYLSQIKPRPYKSSPLDAEIQPSEAQMQRYNRALDIAQQPAIILQRVKDGTLQPSDIQDLTNMYPALYNQMVQGLSNELMNFSAKKGTKADIPYKTKIGLSLFLGQALDSSMSPQSIQSSQMVFTGGAAAQRQQKPQPGAVRPSQKGVQSLGKSQSMYFTPTQNRAAKKLND